MPSFTTSAEVDVTVEYDDGPDGPSICGYSIATLLTPRQEALILAEAREHLAKLTEAAQLAQAISRRDTDGRE